MKRQSYPTDVSDAQWQRLEPLLPPAKQGRTGRPRKYSQREMLNAVFYLVQSGCAWRLLPHDFPPHDAVWAQFRRWRQDGTWARLHGAVRDQVRQHAGRQVAPSAAILDSQSVKTTEKGGRLGSMRGRK